MGICVHILLIKILRLFRAHDIHCTTIIKTTTITAECPYLMHASNKIEAIQWIKKKDCDFIELLALISVFIQENQ